MGLISEAFGSDNHKDPFSRIAGKLAKYTDLVQLAIRGVAGDKAADSYGKFTHENIPDQVNHVVSNIIKPATYVDKAINPIRKIKAVDKVATWTENKPGTTAGLVAAAFGAGSALAGGGSAAGGGTTGVATTGGTEAAVGGGTSISSSLPASVAEYGGTSNAIGGGFSSADTAAGAANAGEAVGPGTSWASKIGDIGNALKGMGGGQGGKRQVQAEALNADYRAPGGDMLGRINAYAEQYNKQVPGMDDGHQIQIYQGDDGRQIARLSDQSGAVVAERPLDETSAADLASRLGQLRG